MKQTVVSPGVSALLIIAIWRAGKTVPDFIDEFREQHRQPTNFDELFQIVQGYVVTDDIQLLKSLACELGIDSAQIVDARTRDTEKQRVTLIKERLPYYDPEKLERLREQIAQERRQLEEAQKEMKAAQKELKIKARLKVRLLNPRQLRILDARERGVTLEEIGKLEGITRERVRQIIKIMMQSNEEWRQRLEDVEQAKRQLKAQQKETELKTPTEKQEIRYKKWLLVPRNQRIVEATKRGARPKDIVKAEGIAYKQVWWTLNKARKIKEKYPHLAN